MYGAVADLGFPLLISPSQTLASTVQILHLRRAIAAALPLFLSQSLMGDTWLVNSIHGHARARMAAGRGPVAPSSISAAEEERRRATRSMQGRNHGMLSRRHEFV